MIENIKQELKKEYEEIIDKKCNNLIENIKKELEKERKNIENILNKVEDFDKIQNKYADLKKLEQQLIIKQEELSEVVKTIKEKTIDNIKFMKKFK